MVCPRGRADQRSLASGRAVAGGSRRGDGGDPSGARPDGRGHDPSAARRGAGVRPVARGGFGRQIREGVTVALHLFVDLLGRDVDLHRPARLCVGVRVRAGAVAARGVRTGPPPGARGAAAGRPGHRSGRARDRRRAGRVAASAESRCDGDRRGRAGPGRSPGAKPSSRPGCGAGVACSGRPSRGRRPITRRTGRSWGGGCTPPAGSGMRSSRAPSTTCSTWRWPAIEDPVAPAVALRADALLEGEAAG